MALWRYLLFACRKSVQEGLLTRDDVERKLLTELLLLRALDSEALNAGLPRIKDSPPSTLASFCLLPACHLGLHRGCWLMYFWHPFRWSTVAAG